MASNRPQPSFWGKNKTFFDREPRFTDKNGRILPKQGETDATADQSSSTVTGASAPTLDLPYQKFQASLNKKQDEKAAALKKEQLPATGPAKKQRGRVFKVEKLPGDTAGSDAKLPTAHPVEKPDNVSTQPRPIVGQAGNPFNVLQTHNDDVDEEGDGAENENDPANPENPPENPTHRQSVNTSSVALPVILDGGIMNISAEFESEMTSWFDTVLIANGQNHEPSPGAGSNQAPSKNESAQNAAALHPDPPMDETAPNGATLHRDQAKGPQQKKKRRAKKKTFLSQLPKDYQISGDEAATLAPTKDLFIFEERAPVKLSRAQLVVLTLNEICVTYYSGLLQWVPPQLAESHGHIDLIYTGKVWDGDAAKSYWSKDHLQRLKFAKQESLDPRPKVGELRITLAHEDQDFVRWAKGSKGEVLLWYGKTSDAEFTYVRDLGTLKRYAPRVFHASEPGHGPSTKIEYLPELDWDFIPEKEQDEWAGLHHATTRSNLQKALDIYNTLIAEARNWAAAMLEKSVESAEDQADPQDSMAEIKKRMVKREKIIAEVRTKIAELERGMAEPGVIIAELYKKLAELERKMAEDEKMAELKKKVAAPRKTMAELQKEMANHEISQR